MLFTSVPPKDSRINEWHFRYRCLNEIRCSYVCSVYTQGSEPSYVACSDNYYASNLINTARKELVCKHGNCYALQAKPNICNFENYMFDEMHTLEKLLNLQRFSVVCIIYNSFNHKVSWIMNIIKDRSQITPLS